jgi:hypothetical protein
MQAQSCVRIGIKPGRVAARHQRSCSSGKRLGGGHENAGASSTLALRRVLGGARLLVLGLFETTERVFFLSWPGKAGNHAIPGGSFGAPASSARA